ncbi:T9SS type A sorting domain-containing protein [Bacteroidota bacterium]
MKKLKIFSIILFALFCLRINAQYDFTNYTNKDHIISLKAEGDSIWIGTTGGLVLRNIDGTLIDVFTLEDGLGSNYINSIVIDYDKNRWLTADEWDVTKQENSVWSRVSFTSAMTTTGDYVYPNFTKLAQDLDSNIWFGGARRIYKYRKDGLYENHSDSLDITWSISAMTVDASNNIWAAEKDGEGGLYMFDGDKWSVLSSSPGLLSNKIYCLKAKGSDVWIGTMGGGLTKFNGSEFISYTTDSGLIDNYVRDIAFEEDTLWIATSDGVSKFDGTNWTYYDEGDGLPYNIILAVEVDANGNKWFGTQGGLYKFDGSSMELIKIDNELFDNNIKDIAIDNNGIKWMTCGSFGSIKDVIKFDGTNWETFNPHEPLVEGSVNVIDIDKKGKKWFGTDVGITVFNDTSKTYYYYKDGFPAYNVSAIAFFEDTVWIVHEYGVSKYFDNTWITYTSADGLLGDLNSVIAVDPEGNVWGGYNGYESVYGVFRISGNSITNYTEIAGETSVVPYEIVVDKDSVVWISLQSGIYRYKEETWIKDDISDYASHDVIFIDNGDLMWFGNHVYITRYDGINYIRLSSSDGATTCNQFYGFAQDIDGSIWTATDGGISHITFHTPDAEFDFSNICFGDTTLFENTSLEADEVTQIRWDINNDGTIESTDHEFEFLFQDTGTYHVKMIADNMGFKDSIIQEVTYFPLPTFNILSNDTVVCVGDSAGIIMELTGTAPWELDFPGYVVETSSSPYIYYMPTYTTSFDLFKLSDSSGCAIPDTQILGLVEYQQIPTGFLASALNEDVICIGDSVMMGISANGTLPLNVSFMLADSAINITTDDNYIQLPAKKAGEYYITEITDSIGCTAIQLGDTLMFEAFPKPVAQITGPDSICQGDTALVSVYLEGTPPWNLFSSLGNFTSIYEEDNPVELHIYESSGINITDITDSSGCPEGEFNNSHNVTVNELPNAVITGGISVCEGDSMHFYINILTGMAPYNLTYSGGTATGITNTDLPYDIYITSPTNLYIIELVDSFGCVAEEIGDTVEPEFYPIPTGNLIADTIGDNANISINLTGTPPWQISYKENDQTNTFIAFEDQNPYTFEITLDSAVYKIVTLRDNYCDATELGDSIVIITDITENINYNKFRNIKFYPNPGTDQLYIDFRDYTANNLTIKIIDINGRIHLNKKYYNIENSIETVDLTGLTKGIYIIEIHNSEIYYRAKLVIK